MNLYFLLRLVLLGTWIALVSNCQSYESLNRLPKKGEKTREWIWISEDVALREVLAKRFEGDLFNRREDFTKIASIEVSSVESDIRSGKSLLYSLATLTLGTFEYIESEFTFTVQYLDGEKVDRRKFKSKTQRSMKTAMPPYIGLGTTTALAILNRYKTPEHLRLYCLEEKPGTIRKILEADRERYCSEYKKYLYVAWESVEPSIEKDLIRRRR